MGSCAKKTFRNVTAEQFTCICQQIESKFGVTLPGDSGQITQSGFTVEWDYDSQTQEFDVQCLDSPVFVPCTTINQAGGLDLTHNKFGAPIFAQSHRVKVGIRAKATQTVAEGLKGETTLLAPPISSRYFADLKGANAWVP